MEGPITTESRRQERERAMSLLYEAEIKNESAAELCAGLALPPTDFVRETVTGTHQMKDQLDADIAKHAIGWELARMPIVDLSILRMGAFELHQRPALSTALIISEAVELAKRFGEEESSKFVNGVLSAIAKDIRGDEPVLR